jgi:hypothetical protein
VVQGIAAHPQALIQICKTHAVGGCKQLAGPPRWDVSFILVTNEAGYERYCRLGNPEGRLTFCEELAAALNDLGLWERVTAATVEGWWKVADGWQPDSAATMAALRERARQLGMGCPWAQGAARQHGGDPLGRGWRRESSAPTDA